MPEQTMTDVADGGRAVRQRPLWPATLLVMLLLGALAGYAYSLVRTAWLSDDSYITFRTVGNFVSGYGITWNVGERVQAYTHPLWMLLLSGLFLVTGGDIYSSAIFGSMALSLGAVLVYVLAIARGRPQAVLGLVILLFSKAFIDYSTSGLENPLSYLLVSLFAWHYLRGGRAGQRAVGGGRTPGAQARTPGRQLHPRELTGTAAGRERPAPARRLDRAAHDEHSGTGPVIIWPSGSPQAVADVRRSSPRDEGPDAAGACPRLLLLSLLAGLLVLNRMDLLLLVGPALLAAFWRDRGLKAAGAVLLGFLPLIGWEAFSVIYYGFPFPNTAYAKLHTGISSAELVRQGWHYLLNSLSQDRVTLPAISCAVAAALITRRGGRIALSVGIVLYLLYVVRIGGDFMSGRYFAVPLLMAVAILGTLEMSSRPGMAGWTAGVLAAVGLGLSSPNPSILTDGAYGMVGDQLVDAHGIADERGWYYIFTGLMRSNPRIGHRILRDVNKVRERHETVIVSSDTIGLFGYYVGPQVHIVDLFALADPLLARLPVKRLDAWRIGHFKREVPAGYVESLRSGHNEIADPQIHAMYDRILLATRGPLFTSQRWAAIWQLNVAGGGVSDARTAASRPAL